MRGWEKQHLPKFRCIKDTMENSGRSCFSPPAWQAACANNLQFQIWVVSYTQLLKVQGCNSPVTLILKIGMHLLKHTDTPLCISSSTRRNENQVRSGKLSTRNSSKNGSILHGNLRQKSEGFTGVATMSKLTWPPFQSRNYHSFSWASSVDKRTSQERFLSCSSCTGFPQVPAFIVHLAETTAQHFVSLEFQFNQKDF